MPVDAEIDIPSVDIEAAESSEHTTFPLRPIETLTVERTLAYTSLLVGGVALTGIAAVGSLVERAANSAAADKIIHSLSGFGRT